MSLQWLPPVSHISLFTTFNFIGFNFLSTKSDKLLPAFHSPSFMIKKKKLVAIGSRGEIECEVHLTFDKRKCAYQLCTGYEYTQSF